MIITTLTVEHDKNHQQELDNWTSNTLALTVVEGVGHHYPSVAKCETLSVLVVHLAPYPNVRPWLTSMRTAKQVQLTSDMLS